MSSVTPSDGDFRDALRPRAPAARVRGHARAPVIVVLDDTAVARTIRIAPIKWRAGIGSRGDAARRGGPIRRRAGRSHKRP